jgi:3-oxoacyl-[acyl-carrier protein] reductase
MVAAEYSRDGVRMNVVSCGPISTPVAQAVQAAGTFDFIPMGRPGSSEEVANAVVFLASPVFVVHHRPEPGGRRRRDGRGAVW